MNEFGLSLGSNVGDKRMNIRCAIERLRQIPEISIGKVSPLFRSSPWGKTDQDWFLNACAVGSTAFSPHALLECCQGLENELGRVREVHWGPRTIDIDILYFGDLRMETDTLTLPHPQMFNRAFVLIPLAFIDQERIIAGRPLKQAIDELRFIDSGAVQMAELSG